MLIVGAYVRLCCEPIFNIVSMLAATLLEEEIGQFGDFLMRRGLLCLSGFIVSPFRFAALGSYISPA
jgi:hypothetical protein